MSHLSWQEPLPALASPEHFGFDGVFFSQFQSPDPKMGQTHWNHDMSNFSWLEFKFIRNSVAFLSFFQLKPNLKHKLWEPGASWCLQLLSKIDFSVSAVTCSTNLAAEHWTQLEPCFLIQQKFSQLGAFQTQQIIF